MFRYNFLPVKLDGQICIEPLSLGREWLVEVGDPDIFSYRAGRGDLIAVLVDVSYQVCFTIKEISWLRSIFRSRRQWI